MSTISILQADGAIWYEACKDVPQGTELLVWYGDCYLQFMGVPVALKEMADGGAQEEADSEWRCAHPSTVKTSSHNVFWYNMKIWSQDIGTHTLAS